jgi:hypothetical protein
LQVILNGNSQSWIVCKLFRFDRHKRDDCYEYEYYYVILNKQAVGGGGKGANSIGNSAISDEYDQSIN